VENGAAGGYARSMTRGAEAQLGCHLRDIRASVVAKHPPHVRPVVLGLVSGFAVAALTSAGFADTIDPRLIGGWTASAADCQKFFERTNGELTYRQPVDRFAQAFIIDPGQIRSPTGTCRIVSVGHDKNGTAVSLDCHDSISFQSETVHFKIHSGAEILYSPTGDPSLDTTYQKCRL
jgi:hypothetical protein